MIWKETGAMTAFYNIDFGMRSFTGTVSSRKRLEDCGDLLSMTEELSNADSMLQLAANSRFFFR